MSEPTKHKFKKGARIRIHTKTEGLEKGQRVMGRDTFVTVVATDRETGEEHEIEIGGNLLAVEWRVDARDGYSRATLFASGVEIDVEGEVDTLAQHNAHLHNLLEALRGENEKLRATLARSREVDEELMKLDEEPP